MKPDWKDAPKWATHGAYNAFKQWVWYSTKPVYRGGYSYSLPTFDDLSKTIGDQFDWRATLEARPEPRNTPEAGE